MNNKGIVPVFGMVLGGIIVIGVMVGSAYKPTFIERKALEVCESNGESDCGAKIGAMTYKERLDYQCDPVEYPNGCR